MPPQIALTLTILIAAIALFLSERLSADVVSLLAMLALVVTGLLTPAEAFASFANPVVVAIGSIFVLSAALFQTGVATSLGRGIVRLAGDSEPRLIAALMVAAALLSSVMNNVAVTAVLMPAVMGISLSTGRAPSRLLLPLAYAAMVGGTLTLVGSPPNLIASHTLAEGGYAPLGLLDITPIGALNLLVTTLFMLTLGRRMLPDQPIEDRLRRARLPGQLLDLYRLPERVFILRVPPGSSLVGQTLAESSLGSELGLTVLGIIRGSGCQMAPPATHRLQADDRLLAQGGPRRLKRAVREKGLLKEEASVDEAELLTGDVGVAEVTLTPRSSLAGQSLRELDFRERYGLTVLALWRGGEPVERDIGDERLRQGDAFLVQGPWSKIRFLHKERGLLVISEDRDVPRRTRKAPWAVAILVGMVGAVVAQVLPLAVAALAAALLIIMTGCLHIEEARDAVEWRVVFLIAGMLALGSAMQKTGTSQWIALTILSPLARLGPLAVIAALLLVTAGLTLGISNHAAAALLAPIALSAAVSQGFDPRPGLLAVAVGTTVALFTPFSHPSFLLVMGPGSYKFRDYLRVGLPLSAAMLAATLLGLAVLWGGWGAS
ncbi:MAG: SLC13 family permease [Anaerolineae bacterium]|nr:MAG: SLC13 family permease [Anaerolineae bacterium]